MLKRLALLVGALTVTVALAACGGDDDAAPKSAASSGTPPAGTAAPRELKDVTVGSIPIMIGAPFFVGIEKGYFAAEGLNLKLERVSGDPDMLVQTAAGNFDIGSGGMGAAVFNAAAAAIQAGRETPFEVVAPLHNEKPPVTTPLVVSKARYDSGELTKVSDLKGKKVSIKARGGLEYWLQRALQSGGLSYDDVTVTIVPFPEVAAALKNKSIDAAMLGEPLVTLGEDNGLVKILSEDFVNGEQPTAVYWNRAWAKKNPDLAAGFLRAYLKAVGDLESGGWSDPAVISILEKYTQVPADVIRRSARPYNDASGKLNVESLRRQEAFFKAQGLLTYDGQLDYSKFMMIK